MAAHSVPLRRYDPFLCSLSRGAIVISDGLSPLDGETRCTGRYFEVIRTVIRLEFAGYQFHNGLKASPYVREVYSCGHSHEWVLGSFNWRKPRKTADCFSCSDAIPPIDDGYDFPNPDFPGEEVSR